MSNLEHNKENLHRGLKERHIQMIALLLPPTGSLDGVIMIKNKTPG